MSNLPKKFVALCAIVVLAPLCIAFGCVAAVFAIQQLINGWIPSNWFSNSSLDWIFSDGTEGGATNYFGFMLSAVPASMCGLGVRWGYRTVRETPG